MKNINEAYELAKARYAEYGVNVDAAIEKLAGIPVSMHCWQGDDVIGFENPDGALTGGIQTTGNYPGKARSLEELFADIEKSISLIPGTKRLNVHAIYGDFKVKPNRDEIAPEHFKTWVEWGKRNNISLDFNPTNFSHPLSADGFTISHPKKEIRDFWIRHEKACREIAAYMGREQGNPCAVNHWFPDGMKDITVDKLIYRERMRDGLDEVFSVKYPKEYIRDGIESKLFGIGAESYTVGSGEFALGYAATRDIMVTLDAGHFHPTEVISDKISAVFCFVDEILLHVSRPVRWDSDHVIVLDDELRHIGEELVRNDFLPRTHIGLDYFDASINRIAAWTIGMRNMQKSLLLALLEPTACLKKLEQEQNYTDRLALLEEIKTLPFGAVWEYYCEKQGVPAGREWLDEVHTYEKEVLSKR